MIIWKHLLHVI